MNRNDVELIEKETPFKGYFQIDRYVLKHKDFTGRWIGPMTREVFERGHAVAVVLYDPDLDSLVMVEQFRAGVYASLAEPWMEDDASPWMLEIVAGIVEKGEAFDDVTVREAREESGCTISDMFRINRYYLTPGACTETITLYCAKVDASGVGGYHGLDEEHEDIKVHVVPVAQAFEWMESGKIINATAMIGLQWFKLNYESVRARWS